MKAYLLPAALVLIFCQTIIAAPVELVKDGTANSEIIIAEDANQSVKLAAKDLQHFIKEISGAELKILNNKTEQVPIKIYIGESSFTQELGFKPTKFENSGYEIVTGKNYVILSGYDRLSPISPFTGKDGLEKWQKFTGEKFSTSCIHVHLGYRINELNFYSNDDTGSWYAASDLLEQIGVRFYAPYEDGTVIPKLKNISIKPQTKKVGAAFEVRQWAGGREADGASWLKRIKCGNYKPVSFNHLTYAIFELPEQKKLHPEYYAYEEEGKPYSGSHNNVGMPRFSDPGFRKASVILARKMLDAFPEMYALLMGQPDGGIRLDYRDADKYGDGDRWQKISNYFWEYTTHIAREIKKTHPDKKLIYFCYGRGVSQAPTIVGDVPDNLILSLPSPRTNDVMETTFKATIAENQKWIDTVKPAGFGPSWDYFDFYTRPFKPRVPVFFTELLQNKMKAYKDICNGKFTEVSCDFTSRGKKRNYPGAMRIGEYPILSLMMYWQSKLYWNLNIDRNAFLEEYYRLFFGPAADEMKKFHEFSEEVWCRQESRSVTQTTGFLKPEDVDKYFTMLTQARQRVEKNSIYDRRIAKMEKAYEPLKKFFPNLTRKGFPARVYVVDNDFKINGDMSKYKSFLPLRFKHTGKLPEENKTDFRVAITKDRTKLFIAVICYETNMDKIKAKTTLNDDGGIFYDDTIDIYLNTPKHSFFQIAVNPNGARWDRSTDTEIINRDTLDILWNPDIKSVVKKYDNRWVVELMIPTDDFGKIGPARQYPWGIQIGRTRMAGEKTEFYSFGLGPGGYGILNQWGNLWAE